MKALQTKFTRRGFVFNQIQRNETVAIYSQTSIVTDQIVAYEVIKILRALASERFGRSFEPMELYPSDEQFGLNGWSYGDYGDLSKALVIARNKYNQISIKNEESS